MRYRKKPVEIEAIQWNGENTKEIHEFINNAQYMEEMSTNYNDDFYLNIYTLEGAHKASVGDYIIKGVHGEFYPCKPDIFHKTYDKVD